MARATQSSAKNDNGSGELRITSVGAKKLRTLRKRFGHFISVNRKSYELVYCASVEFQGQPVAGLCCPEEKQIFIDASGPEETIVEILMHELLHGEITEAGFRQRGDWDQNMEEILCDTVGKFIAHSFTVRIRKPTP